MWIYLYWVFVCVSYSISFSVPEDGVTITEEAFTTSTPEVPSIKYHPLNRHHCQHCGCGERNEEPRVLGGLDSHNNAYPWLARLIYHKAFGCGASLINDNYVISAAHCVKGFMWFMFKVTFGEHDRCDRSERPETRYVLRILAHNFSLTVLNNDISLIRLNEPVVYSHAVRPICLPKDSVPPGTPYFHGIKSRLYMSFPVTQATSMPNFIGIEAWKENLYTGAQATVAGWGATGENGNWSCTLLEADLPVLSNEACRHTKYNASKILDVMMCAGYPETAHKDACTGDSGGPLVAENNQHYYELIGVVSWGYGCARKGYPGVYTRVTKYLDWIKDNTEDSCYCSY